MLILKSVLKLAREVIRPTKSGHMLLPLANGYSLELLDRPGVWASTEELENLTREIRAVYSKSMNGVMADYGVLSGTRDDLKRRLISIVRAPNGAPIAFCAQARLRVMFGQISEDVVHLGLVAVDPDHRRGGVQGVLYSLPVLYLFFASGLSRLYFTNVTQVPAIIGQCEDYFYDVYPSTDVGAEQKFHHFRIAKTVFERYKSYFGVGEDAVFLEDRQIIQNSYTGGSDNLKKSFDSCAPHRRAEVNEFCRENLDYARGDDFIQVGVMDFRTFFKFYSSRQSGNVLARILIGSVSFALQRAIVPTLRWVTHG